MAECRRGDHRKSQTEEETGLVYSTSSGRNGDLSITWKGNN